MSKLALTIEGFGESGSTTIQNPTPQFTNISDLISRGLEVGFIIAGFLLVFWLIWGIFQYLFAGGNKDSLAKAKGRITWAIVGFIIIIISFFVSGYFEDVLQPLGRVVSTGIKEGGTAGAPAEQPGAVAVPLSDFYSTRDLYFEDGTPKSFEADCGEGCVRPLLYRIPYIYHQYRVTLNTADENVAGFDEWSRYGCSATGSRSPGGASCGPTSLAMIAEAFRTTISSSGADPARQTANNLNRFFLDRKIMSCAEGTTGQNPLDYFRNPSGWASSRGLGQEAARDNPIEKLGVRIVGISYDGFASLESWYRSTGGYPVWTGTFYFSDPHFVALAGISDNYVWIADPLGPDDQVLLRIDRATYLSRFNRNKFYKVCPPNRTDGVCSTN